MIMPFISGFHMITDIYRSKTFKYKYVLDRIRQENINKIYMD